jgi:hypothetical protein
MPPLKQLSHNGRLLPVLQLAVETGSLTVGDFAGCSVVYFHRVLNYALDKVLVKDPQELLVSVNAKANKCVIVGCKPKAMTDVDCKARVVAARRKEREPKGGGKPDPVIFQVTDPSQAVAIVEKAKQV